MLLPSGGMRFTSTNYTLPNSSVDFDFSSPAKRPRTDLDDRWKAAVDEMIRTDAKRNDGLPPRLTSLQSGTTFDQLMDCEEITSDDNLSDDEKTEIHHPPTSFIDPGPDPMLNIPGERVFARVSNSRRECWPAMITGYIPATAPGRRGKYGILFFDGVRKIVNRTLFYTSFDDGFSTCKVAILRHQTMPFLTTHLYAS
jgi:hypothetical protein